MQQISKREQILLRLGTIAAILLALWASHEQSFTRLPLQLLNRVPQIPAHELRVPIDPVQGDLGSQ